jgi:hypothetical protein
MHHRRSAVVAGCALVTVVTGILFAQSSTRAPRPTASGDRLDLVEAEMEMLREKSARLESRVVQLESVVFTGAERSQRAARPRGERMMQIEEVMLIETDLDEFRVVEAMLAEADKLKETAEQIERSLATSSGSRGGNNSRDLTEDRRRRAQSRLMADYKSRARAKRGEALRLKRRLEEPRQRVMGTDGMYTIELRTDRDLSCVLDRVAIGELISWEGRRIELTEVSQLWEITAVEIVDSGEIE